MGSALGSDGPSGASRFGLLAVPHTPSVARLACRFRLQLARIALRVRIRGLAPRTRRSGTIRYREPTSHGRAGLRQALFNAARAAIRHPSPFRDFYDRLVRQNRRPGKVALTAVMRKLVITANAVARDRQPWHGRRPTTPEPQRAAQGADRTASQSPVGQAGSRPQPRFARWRPAPALMRSDRWATPMPSSKLDLVHGRWRR